MIREVSAGTVALVAILARDPMTATLRQLLNLSLDLVHDLDWVHGGDLLLALVSHGSFDSFLSFDRPPPTLHRVHGDRDERRLQRLHVALYGDRSVHGD